MISVTPSQFLSQLSGSDPAIKSIYTTGGCYQLYKLLKLIYPTAEAMIQTDGQHVATLIGGKLYDIGGVIDDAEATYFEEMIQANHKEAETWSFSKSMALALGECKYCEEPILIEETSK